jgi:ABC-type nitrate/sulfonate/bicarbonate transport system substrate-binding protein
MKIVRLVLVLAAVVALAACGGKDKKTTDEKSLTPVVFQMSWTHEYSSAPFYIAVENNRFRDQRLDVTLEEGGFQDGQYVDSIQEVLDGKAQFGATDLSGVLQARAAGKPLIAVGAVTQRSPFALISLPASAITRPQDLVGKTVAITDGGARLTYNALLDSLNIDPASVNTISRTSFGIDPLLNGEVDVLGGWIINEGQLVREAGYEPNIILLSDYGFDSYDFLIITTEDMIANQKDTVTAFMSAFKQGLQDAVDNPDKAAELAVARNSTLDLAGQKARMHIFLPLINPAGGTLGGLDPEIFKFNYDLLLNGGVIAQPFDVTQAYTLDFVK